MIKSVKYSRQVNFLGRNGFFKQAGLDIQAFNCNYPTGIVILSPLTSRGNVARCQIEIPLGDVPSVIEALQKAIK